MDNNYQPIAPMQPMQSMQPQANIQVTKKDNTDLIKNVVIISTSILALIFLGLFIWQTINYNDAKTDLESKINIAVAEAKDAQAEELEAEFAVREKDPYKTFAGPVDYGELSFKYPKTWSVYIEEDANNGGNFKAHLNPDVVNTVSKETLDALKVTIRTDSFEKVVSEYQKYIDAKDSKLSVETITVNGVTANKYSGTLPNSTFKGYIVIFKIRDKAAILETDSVLFKDDFEKIIETIEFNA